jgi:YgiT-type zinc finger domain-containing protein
MIYLICKKQENDVKCVICRGDQTRPGHTAVTLERETTTLAFKAVPAEICANRGEAYVAEEVSRQILAAAELAARSGVQVDVPEFVGPAE